MRLEPRSVEFPHVFWICFFAFAFSFADLCFLDLFFCFCFFICFFDLFFVFVVALFALFLHFYISRFTELTWVRRC